MSTHAMIKTSSELYKAKTLKNCQQQLNAVSVYPYTITLGGRQFICNEGVFGSDADYAFPELLDNIPVGKNMLEIGTGHGGFMACLYLHKPGAIEHILATDINPLAVENAKLNFAEYAIPADVRVSDMFENIAEKFDAIFWNAPYLYTTDELSMLDKSLADTDYRCIEVYIRDGGKYLEDGGRVTFMFSREVGEWELLQTILEKHGKRVEVLWQSEVFTGVSVTKRVQLLEVLEH